MIAVLNQPASLPDDALYEVVDGVVVEKAVSIFAVWIANEIGFLLNTHVRTRRLGWVLTEAVFVLDVTSNLRRRPDLAFVSDARWPVAKSLPTEGDWILSPDLAVEIASPSNTLSELLGKVREYFEHGVAEVWLVVPEERLVYVYRSPRDVTVRTAVDTLSTPLVPDWSVVVGDVIPALSESGETQGAG
ncbi:MAG: Uma2 family endonuclease [Planctomycetaceae bacterium]|nr:Uma2 family endonuclease [Planctomycetaceae bacterium]